MFDPVQSAIFTEVFGLSPEAFQLARENDWWDLLDDEGNQIELPDEVDAAQLPLM